jgi:hypothetical protein
MRGIKPHFFVNSDFVSVTGVSFLFPANCQDSLCAILVRLPLRLDFSKKNLILLFKSFLGISLVVLGLLKSFGLHFANHPFCQPHVFSEKYNEYFCDAMFVELAVQAFLEKHQDTPDDVPIPQFNCSDGFIHDFKARNHISSRRSHMHRRPSVSPADEQCWVRRLHNLIYSQPHDRILNVDETAWRVYPTGLRTWAEKGSQGVQINIAGNEKDSLTVLATVRADRTKLPLVILAAGKTARVEGSQLGDIGIHFSDHSESGWTTTETFIRYLHWLRDTQYKDDLPLWLVLDCYSVHRDEAVKACAESLNIVLEFLPPGMTDSFQPLDRYVFGCMKAKCRRLFRMHVAWDPSARLDTRIAVQWLIQAWEAVGANVLKEAWGIYFDEDGEELDGEIEQE